MKLAHDLLIYKSQIPSYTTYLNTSELWVLKAQTATAKQFQELAALLGWSEKSARKKFKTSLVSTCK